MSGCSLYLVFARDFTLLEHQPDSNIWLELKRHFMRETSGELLCLLRPWSRQLRWLLTWDLRRLARGRPGFRCLSGPRRSRLPYYKVLSLRNNTREMVSQRSIIVGGWIILYGGQRWKQFLFYWHIFVFYLFIYFPQLDAKSQLQNIIRFVDYSIGQEKTCTNYYPRKKE